MAGRNWSLKWKRLIKCHLHWGGWGGSCCDCALNRGAVFLQEHKAPGRGSQKLTAGWDLQGIFPVLERAYMVRGQKDAFVCTQTTAMGSLQVCIASRFVAMCFFVGVGPALFVLLEPIIVHLQSTMKSHPLQVRSKPGRAASFALGMEEFSRNVSVFLENNRKAWPNCCSKYMPVASDRPSRI